ncbi:cupin domain-containing protein [Spirulina sp. CS-785/01]|uniref:cupin domain-containing protein n=1 Tax=Spirulina sp. CS-785/01 TaxID=3021716 RepID=UPI00232B2978|nr:cupin domain-containing protein [Spirulina sp. CS-785/01]MDB9314069.1 cupin domain-containing protein [Spirulina sp. CS-785/01]
MSNLILSLPDAISYSESGILSKVLFKDESCQYTLFCLSAGTEIEEHTSTRNAMVQVLEGTGQLWLEKEEVTLTAGKFILMPANIPHALKAESNLAFLLTLSERVE